MGGRKDVRESKSRERGKEGWELKDDRREERGENKRKVESVGLPDSCVLSLQLGSVPPCPPKPLSALFR